MKLHSPGYKEITLRPIALAAVTAAIVLVSPMSAHAAAVDAMPIWGLRLGMPIDEALRTLAGRPGGRIISTHYYDCVEHRVINYRPHPAAAPTPYVAPQYRPHLVNPEVTPPPFERICTDDVDYSESVELQNGMRQNRGSLTVTFLPRIPGEASSQVVARVVLVTPANAAPVKNEGMPVHYYEHLAIARYGTPTYTDPFAKSPFDRPFKNETAAGQSARMMMQVVGGDHQGEHFGSLAWCSAGVTPAKCASADLPEDRGTSGPRYAPYITPFNFGGAPPPGAPGYDLEYGTYKRGVADLETAYARNHYTLPLGIASTKRLTLRFAGNAEALFGSTAYVILTLEDTTLFKERFETKALQAPKPDAPVF